MKFSELPVDFLEHSFHMEQGFNQGNGSRLDFIGDHIFDFTTYDSGMSELFATKALEICAAISEKRTFDYIADPENYRWYLLMVNMPFFSNRLEWGTSVRGAWWVHELQELDSYGLWRDEEQVLSIEFSRDEWIQFIAALVNFGKAAS